MTTSKSIKFIRLKSTINNIKLEYGSANLDEKQRFIYATYHYPIYINFRKIEKNNYDSLMRKFHFELNRIIYRVVGCTKKNFGEVSTPSYVTSSHISKSLLTIQLTLENKFQTLERNYPMICEIIRELTRFVKAKTSEIEGIN